MTAIVVKMFKEVFKQYKSKKFPPDLSAVCNFNSNAPQNDKIRELRIDIQADDEKEKLRKLQYYGLKPSSEWNMFEIKDKPGLIFIRNPFTSIGQRYWMARSLRDFSCKPNKLNLDIHGDLAEYEDWWEVSNLDPIRGPILLQKLRWTTMGYHHNWDTKVYDEYSKNLFPEDLSAMCRLIGNVLGYNNFSAEAAIVNYYHMDSNLSGHTDHSEQNLDAPLFSFSFGQSAVFLLGGETKEEKPVAMFINSGDIVVMSRESRQCYHAVPCIIKAPTDSWNESMNNPVENFHDEESNKQLVIDCSDDVFWWSYNEYMRTSRININVRQVLQPGQERLS